MLLEIDLDSTDLNLGLSHNPGYASRRCKSNLILDKNGEKNGMQLKIWKQNHRLSPITYVDCWAFQYFSGLISELMGISTGARGLRASYRSRATSPPRRLSSEWSPEYRWSCYLPPPCAAAAVKLLKPLKINSMSKRLACGGWGGGTLLTFSLTFTRLFYSLLA